MSVTDLDQPLNEYDITTWDVFADVVRQCFRTAKEHGWWDDPETELPLTPGQCDSDAKFFEKIALMHTELSEAVEEKRNSSGSFYVKEGKPEGTLVELADVVVRIFDYVGGIDRVDVFVDALKAKMAYNEGRPYRHGGKRA